MPKANGIAECLRLPVTATKAELAENHSVRMNARAERRARDRWHVLQRYGRKFAETHY